jgi:hypothetical protein
MLDKHEIPLSRRQLAGSILWGVVSVVFGWSLFVYWWREVLRQDQPRPLVNLVLTVAVFCGFILLVAVLWIWHNRRLARGGRRGLSAAYRVASFERDALGRTIALPADDSVRTASIVMISADAGTKTYEAEEPEAA